MLTLRLIGVSIAVLMAMAPPAIAESPPNTQNAVAEPASADFSQMLYKGIVGNVLEKLPMDAEQRVTLQRTNAVVSNIFSGRSLSLLVNATNPVLLIGGIVWGLWAASNIKPAANASAVATLPDVIRKVDVEHETRTETGQSPAENSGFASRESQPIRLSAITPTESGISTVVHTRVIKVWLSQP